VASWQLALRGLAVGKGRIGENRLSLPTQRALIMSVLTGFQKVTKKWTKPVRKWGYFQSQFIFMFEGTLRY
jgi:transposase-like protein